MPTERVDPDNLDDTMGQLIARVSRSGPFLSWVQTDLDEMKFCNANRSVLLEILADATAKVLIHRYGREERAQAWEMAMENTLMSIIIRRSTD